MRIFEKLNVDFLGKRRLFYIISTVLFLLGLLNMAFRGLEFGIDFKGGSEIVLQFQRPIEIGQIRGYVDNIGLGNVEVKTFGGETGVLVRTELQNVPEEIMPQVISSIETEIKNVLPDAGAKLVNQTSSTLTYRFENPDTANLVYNGLLTSGFQIAKVSEEPTNTDLEISVGIADWVKENLREKMGDNTFTVLKEDRVGPKVGQELKQDALIAVLLSLVAILIYLAFRFKFIFAVGAVAALFHDVLITLGLYSILYGVIPGLNLEIDLTVVAAFLTLVGYSINDTVVVFDRVRENLKIHKTLPIKDVINTSINQTMSRTIITGVTTLLVLLVLLILGGDVLRAFAFTLSFGIIIGTYSSIFVASSLVLEYANRTKKRVEF